MERARNTLISFVALVAAVALAKPPALPPECALPALRDLASLKQAAQEDANLSMGLDSVATWCFDSEGNYNAGWSEGKDRPKKQPDTPSPDCGRAIGACEKALAVVTKNQALHQLNAQAVADLARAYVDVRYAIKRAGLSDQPADDANCRSKRRGELFTQAQTRMEHSRVHAQVQSEYADYRAWLVGQSIRCTALAAEARKKGTKVSLLDAPQVASGAARPFESDAGSAERPGLPSVASNAEEHRDGLSRPMPEKWRYLAEKTAAIESDPDFKTAFFQSRELRDCTCSRVNAQSIVRALERSEGGEAGLALLTAEDPANTRCVLCWLSAYQRWKARASSVCEQMAAMGEYELNKLEQSDDGPGLPQRCFERAREARSARHVAAPDAGPGYFPDTSATRAPLVPGQVADGGGARASIAGPTPVTEQPGQSSANRTSLATVGGYTYYRPPDAGTPAPRSVPVASLPGPASPVPSSPAIAPRSGSSTQAPVHEVFVPPSSYAPTITREEGRLYVRISMSSACVAEITPGPVTARNGDLIVVPLGAKLVEVKSPCGGVAEIYFGKEPSPRFSEVFGRNQPVSFVFRPQ